jgi:hypothetical protein
MTDTIEFETIFGDEVALRPDYNGGCYVLQHRNAKGKLNGYTCYGYDNCLRDTNLLLAWIATITKTSRWTSAANRGTFQAYETYKFVLAMAEKLCRDNRTRCDIHLTPQLKGLEGKRVEVVDLQGEKHRFRVGRSTGWCPAHLDGNGFICDREYQSVRVLK